MKEKKNMYERDGLKNEMKSKMRMINARVVRRKKK